MSVADLAPEGLRRRYKRRKESAKLELLSAGLDYKFQSLYGKNTRCQLMALCDKYGSDRGSLMPLDRSLGWPAHTYADFYALRLKYCRLHIKRVFERGIRTYDPEPISSMGVGGRPGASLWVWHDYFPNAEIYGAEIDRSILFQGGRIRTHYEDQCDPAAVETCWSEIGKSDFDLIIDGGLLTFAAVKVLFENSIRHLSRSGIYIIEDVRQRGLLLYNEYFANSEYVVEFVNLFRSKLNLMDNNLVVIRHSQ